MMRIAPARMASAAALVLVSVMLTGCVSGSPSTNTPTGTNRPAETTEAPPEAGNPVFGDSFEWSDGLAITVSAPAGYQPSASAYAPEAAAYVVFTVTIVNGSDENYEPAFTASMQSGNTESEQVFDIDQGVSGGPTTTLLPGREVTFPLAFGVSDPEDLVLEVGIDFAHDTAIFTS
ncbi:hypothetical protein [Pseudolysinimonas yzui]|uniref:DUF4352 domain-containing protein n=1 Tax=Pseudolysinimonas yzui TaxID=2708254 RepID=A0A8J3GSF5_9MICO|nr:hypothetical protein [Pseudolysinimonas yzui]GHF22489.1 hypothetical protein GCM10011600_24490 [Pseudolysinimonas yzui]